MIKTIIIDDESKSIEVIRYLLDTYCADVKVVGSAEKVDVAIDLINQQHPDLIFLDVEMNEETGFDLLDKVQSRNFQVVFITAYSQYAVKAFRYSVTDYLLKPVNIDELTNAVEKVKSRIENMASLKEFDSGSFQTLRIPSNHGMQYVSFDQIIRLEADGVYTHLYLEGGKRCTSSYNLKQYEEHLDSPQFMRVHRGDIINLAKVKSYTTLGITVAHLTDGTKVKVARRNRKEFIKKVGEKG